MVFKLAHASSQSNALLSPFEDVLSFYLVMEWVEQDFVFHLLLHISENLSEQLLDSLWDFLAISGKQC